MKRFNELALPVLLAAPVVAGVVVVVLLLNSGATGDRPADTASAQPSEQPGPTPPSKGDNPRHSGESRGKIANTATGEAAPSEGMSLAENTDGPFGAADPSSDPSAGEARTKVPPPLAEDNGAAGKSPTEEENFDDSGFFHITPEDRKRLEEERKKELDRIAREEAEAIKRLGEPLVDRTHLRKLHEKFPIWVDPVNKRVVMIGEVCRRDAPLEMFACPHNTKEHESILSVRTQAYLAHAALLALGAKPGHPARFEPKYQPATGTEIEVKLYWKDKDGKLRSARAQDWVRNADTGKALAYPWVFAGSGFWKDQATGQERYLAEDGDFICVSNFSTAMLDLPVESSQSNASLMFECFTERIPPTGTAVTMVLEPKLPEKPTSESSPKEPENAQPRQPVPEPIG